MKNEGKVGKAKAEAARSDRKSGTGMSGSPKKGGSGGKFTWSGDRLSKEEMKFEKGAIDSKDPNYEDPEPEAADPTPITKP